MIYKKFILFIFLFSTHLSKGQLLLKNLEPSFGLTYSPYSSLDNRLYTQFAVDVPFKIRSRLKKRVHSLGADFSFGHFSSGALSDQVKSSNYKQVNNEDRYSTAEFNLKRSNPHVSFNLRYSLVSGARKNQFIFRWGMGYTRLFKTEWRTFDLSDCLVGHSLSPNAFNMSYRIGFRRNWSQRLSQDFYLLSSISRISERFRVDFKDDLDPFIWSFESQNFAAVVGFGTSFQLHPKKN